MSADRTSSAARNRREAEERTGMWNRSVGEVAADIEAAARSAAHTGDADRLRALMDEWEATAEMGWSRPLTVEEARCVLSALSEGVAAMTTAEWERMRKISRG